MVISPVPSELLVPRLQADHVWLLKLELGRVLDGHQPFAVSDLAGKRVHERGLAGACAAADENVDPRPHSDAKELRHRRGQHLLLCHLPRGSSPAW